jgi:hypothetical protein
MGRTTLLLAAVLLLFSGTALAEDTLTGDFWANTLAERRSAMRSKDVKTAKLQMLVAPCMPPAG